MVLLGIPVFLLQKHVALYSGKKLVLSDIIIFQVGNIFSVSAMKAATLLPRL